MESTSPRTTRTLIMLLLAAIVGGILLIALVNNPITDVDVAETGTTDWPQLQHDAQRSGRSNYGLVGPFTVKWRWLGGNKWPDTSSPADFKGVEIPVLAQPIVGDNKVYVGSYNGKLYAINLDTGNTAWSFTTGGPLLHTAGYAQTKVFTGSSDGNFYAINTADGSLAWKYNTGSIYSAPLVLSDKVCIGSKTNFFYCFGFNGNLIFKYDAGAPMYYSAAANSTGSKIYFGAENMQPYCLDATSTNPNGQVCAGWTPDKIPGQNLIHYWPVFVGDKVTFSTMPIAPTNEIFPAVEGVMDGVSGNNWSTAVEPRLIEYYQTRPFYQTLFVLDATTGKKAANTASSHIGAHQDAFSPPVVGDNGNLLLVYRGKDSSFQGSSYGSKYNLDIGLLNPTSGKITPIGTTQQYSAKMSTDMDDNIALTSAPGLVYGIHNGRCLVGVDMQAKNDFMVGQIVNEMRLSHCSDAQNFPSFFVRQLGTNIYPDIAGYNNRGEGMMGASISNNTVFMVFRGGAVFALTGTRK